ncbi:paraquat-inducible protein A [Paraburkholderia terrae]|uniref:Paraquat-inducible membrane protein A n=1 Tax=Paraburkholderia terrae TaxID=311230 RepID=A0ABM7TPQ2_9BURK|nr:paraquat-inducible protein A [Paraburkholderia terrae]BCZ81127.1 paraquat-inducible membrane protein A [Paraburkholderia terrae]BDC40408.1 paraquat-inducible membrane protein A [Paraburkholderia terrae]
MTRGTLIACHQCDLLQRESPLGDNATARCTRCGAPLYRSRPGGLDQTLACTVAALVTFAAANAFPVVGLSVNGNLVDTTLLGAVLDLYHDGVWPIAGLVFLTTFFVPLLDMLALVYLLLPLRVGLAPYRPDLAFRVLHLVEPWCMTEVLILGLLVALVKLSVIATVVPGIGLYAFGVQMLLLAAISSGFEPREIWARICAVNRSRLNAYPAPCTASAPTAASAGFYVCHHCGLLSVAARLHDPHCPRCGAHLHFRTPDSISRTWAFVAAAAFLYVPANVLPVMNTSSLFGAEKDTILSGVVYLWTSGSWPLAIVVFIASIAVPMLKIIALVFLLVTAQCRSRWVPRRRAGIYRLVELVGRWSMLDIYVITMLVALVQFNALATIEAGPAAIAFGAVVVLTMFAAMSFDPRLTWDTAEAHHGQATTGSSQ